MMNSERFRRDYTPCTCDGGDIVQTTNTKVAAKAVVGKLICRLGVRFPPGVQKKRQKQDKPLVSASFCFNCTGDRHLPVTYLHFFAKNLLVIDLPRLRVYIF